MNQSLRSQDRQSSLTSGGITAAMPPDVRKACGLPDVDLYWVCRQTIRCEYDIDKPFHAASRDDDIGLIESVESTLWPGEEHLDRRPSDCNCHCRLSADIAETGAECEQEELITRRPQIYRRRLEDTGSGIELGNLLERIHPASASENNGCGHALPIGVRRKQSW